MNNGEIVTGNWVGRFNVVAFTTLMTLVIHRYGLVATAALLFVDNVITDVPLTTDLWRVVVHPDGADAVAGARAPGLRVLRGPSRGEPLFGQVVSD